jgi:type IV secretion system protein VirB1
MVGFVDMAQHCAPSFGVSTLAAIVRTESNFNPLAIGVNVKKNTPKPKIELPKTMDEAISTANWLLAHNYNIDMGLGQINSSNLSRLGLTVDDMFNPCSNIKTAGVILKGNYQSALKDDSDEQDALYAAISAYNTGSKTKGFSNGYVKSVLNNANIANISSVDIKVPDLIKNTDISVKSSESTSVKLAESSPKKEDSPENKIMVYGDDKPPLENKTMVY